MMFHSRISEAHPGVPMMIVGRAGGLTFSCIIVGTGADNGVEYSEENLMIG
jgi:hypothetical protein